MFLQSVLSYYNLRKRSLRPDSWSAMIGTNESFLSFQPHCIGPKSGSLKAFHTLIWWYTEIPWQHAVLADGSSSDGSFHHIFFFWFMEVGRNANTSFQRNEYKHCRFPQLPWILHKKHLQCQSLWVSWIWKSFRSYV